MYPVFFEKLPQITLSKSRYQVMGFIDLSPYQDIFIEIGQYITTLKYDMQQYLNVHKLSPDPQRSSLYLDMVQDIFNEITLDQGH